MRLSLSKYVEALTSLLLWGGPTVLNSLSFFIYFLHIFSNHFLLFKKQRELIAQVYLFFCRNRFLIISKEFFLFPLFAWNDNKVCFAFIGNWEIKLIRSTKFAWSLQYICLQEISQKSCEYIAVFFFNFLTFFFALNVFVVYLVYGIACERVGGHVSFFSCLIEIRKCFQFIAKRFFFSRNWCRLPLS